MAAVKALASFLATVRLEDLKPNGGLPSQRLSVTKPSWVVRTESNVRKARMEKPDPPCVICHGSGTLHCRRCNGEGRTNYVHLVMLPKGEWPKWCRECGGSGLAYCYYCVGTGEYRGKMGFRFMETEKDGDHAQGTDHQ